MTEIFHPDAQIAGIFKKQIIDWTGEDFIKRIVDNPVPVSLNEKYDKEIIFIDETNDVAIAKEQVVGRNYAATQ